MIEKYEVNGIIYNVSPDMKEQFLNDFRDATLIQPEQQSPPVYEPMGYDTAYQPQQYQPAGYNMFEQQSSTYL